ncbi:TolB domain-containing protein [Priestia koreensis]|uniref:TolB domain-containing protein n=1 Tax=Priestia koreensis TaxID=284581 RepID=UPI00203AF3D2|nr:TolB domain-containing protein [Priestia koreensis]MCM3004976.1 TolB domain-containing protein [Priestia koreensis]
MYKKIIYCAFLLFFLLPSSKSYGVTELKAAFTRQGFLWIANSSHEKKVTTKKSIFTNNPQWSQDGRLIVYEKEGNDIKPDQSKTNEIRVYDTVRNTHKLIARDGRHPVWSPHGHSVAYVEGNALQVSDLSRFRTVSVGVDDFIWTPDGNGFIVSTSADLHPDGWTNPILYKVALTPPSTPYSQKATPFFTIPKELTKGKATIMSINAGDFSFSPDGKWLSFTVSPTASWSMDSDMLCVLSADGKQFSVLDEVILHLDTAKWAPHQSTLAYIAGGGRIVFGFKNKRLSITEMPVYQTIHMTPPHYAELGFSWITDSSLVVSRVVESEWSNDYTKRPKASLYLLNTKTNMQRKLTSPTGFLGDYQPLYVSSIDKLTWLRGKDFWGYGDIWTSDRNGKNAARWIKSVELYGIYNPPALPKGAHER